MKKNFYGEIKNLHKNIVAEIANLMVKHGVVEVDLLGSNCDHAYICGYPGSGSDVQEMEVSKVYFRDGSIWLDVVLDMDTDELGAQNENGDIGDAYQCWRANDFEHFKPCTGIELVYDSVRQVLRSNTNEKPPKTVYVVTFLNDTEYEMPNVSVNVFGTMEAARKCLDDEWHTLTTEHEYDEEWSKRNDDDFLFEDSCSNRTIGEIKEKTIE